MVSKLVEIVLVEAMGAILLEVLKYFIHVFMVKLSAVYFMIEIML